MTNSGKSLQSPFNTPIREQVLTQSSSKKDKTRPFVLERDCVDGLVEREKY